MVNVDWVGSALSAGETCHLDNDTVVGNGRIVPAYSDCDTVVD